MLVARNLVQKIRYNSCIGYLVAGYANRTYLQRLCINTDVQFAPLTTALRAMLFAFPFAFAQKLDASGINEQMQPRLTGPVLNMDLQAALATADCAEVRYRPIQP